VETTGTEHDLAKANFDGIYDQPDPRSYFQTLGDYDYAVPHYGEHVFRQVLDALPVESPTVMDLCCSYGINAALLKHDFKLKELYERYGSDELADVPSAALRGLDQVFYGGRRRPDAPTVVGLDTARNAVNYALDVGLLDDGAAEDLEANEPSPSLAALAESVDLVTVTGGIGYVTQRTFSRLLAAAVPGRPVWVAALCLRTVPFDPIADCLAAFGLVSEQLDGVTFPQRRFTSDHERRYALKELDALGVDPTGREETGWYHVDVFLARPVEDVAERPIDDVLSGLAETVTHFPER
jgi:hypothetical protein